MATIPIIGSLLGLLLMLAPMGFLLKSEPRAVEEARDLYALTGDGWKRMETAYSEEEAKAQAAELQELGYQVEIRR